MRAHDLAMKLLAMEDDHVCIEYNEGRFLTVNEVQYTSDENDCRIIEVKN